MKVVHFSLTPLAGAPIRISTALNKYTDVESRLVVLDPDCYGLRTYEGDLDWRIDTEQAIELAEQADLIHLHNYLDLDSPQFTPIDFRSLKQGGTAFVRQFHSHPDLIAKYSGRNLNEIFHDELPHLVIAQFQERYYPEARIVPNIIPINDELYTFRQKESSPVKIFFSSSTLPPARESRWNTKGYPETRRILSRLERELNKKGISCNAIVVEGIPHAECLNLRRSSHISIDELVTGSYHLTSLESLSMGMPTLCYLDRRTESVVKELTGANNLPWVNTTLEHSDLVLSRLVEDIDVRDALGRYSRRWIEEYWSDKEMVRHYADLYQEILQNGKFKNKRFDPDDPLNKWFFVSEPDLVYRKRLDCIYKKFFWNGLLEYLRSSRKTFFKKIKSLYSKIGKIFITLLINLKITRKLSINKKTISIVGNGPSLLGKKMGPEIDSSDIVIRMNNFKIKGFEHDTGTKFDVFLTNGWEDVTVPESSDFIEVWFSRRIGSSYLSARRAYEFLSGKFCSQINNQFLEEFDREYGTLPSTGLCGLHMLLTRNPAKIKIFGFDHFQDRNLHYFDRAGVEHVTHIADAERESFEQYLIRADAKGIEIDIFK